jgi:hypothetical protein
LLINRHLHSRAALAAAAILLPTPPMPTSNIGFLTDSSSSKIPQAPPHRDTYVKLKSFGD